MASSTPGQENICSEVQGQHSVWVSEVENRLRVVKEDLQTRADRFQILKVPEWNRQPTSAFTPRAWQFGLHNRENLATSGPEEVKLAVVALFGLDEQSAWISFCNDVVPDPTKMLACYGLRDEAMNLKTDEIQRVLAFDALFLAVWMEIELDSSSINFAPGDRRMWTDEHIRMPIEAFNNFLSTFGAWIRIVHFDLYKMENQVPFDLIKKAIKNIQRHTNPQYEHEGHPDPYLEKWMKKAVSAVAIHFMDISDDFYKTEEEEPRLSESHYILGAAHKAICGVSGMRRTKDLSQRNHIRIPSARRLKDSGIKIQGVVGPLCTMSYNKHTKYLSLPKMILAGNTVPFVRNIARYEQYFDTTKCMFHDYVNLMHDLIETPEDLTFLSNQGVIHIPRGPIGGFEMWKDVGRGLLIRYSCKEHNQMKRDINSRCNLRRHRIWSEFQTLFFSRPWLTISVIAATLVTVATLIQAYAAVVGSNGMRPHYNP